jgi:hypothetical protein
VKGGKETMEHYMLITIKEFVERGGRMYRGDYTRHIFYPNGIQFECHIKELYDDIVVNQSESYYVKVTATPTV